MRRGVYKPGLPPGVPVEPRCAAMAVGSVPHTEIGPALDLVLRTTPEVPAWPQMPRRSFLENMYVQFSEGLPGLVVDAAAQRMIVRSELPAEEVAAFVELLESGDLAPFAISAEYAAGLQAMGDLLSRLPAPATLVKGQITGPASFCLQTTDEERKPVLYDDTVREMATELLTARARWQEAYLAGLAPRSVVLLMVDEPFLTQWGSGYLSMPDDLIVPPLTRLVGSLGCLVGIHVCGGTDWTKVTQLPLDLLNFDAADHLDALLAHAGAVASFVEEGGLLAWGAVPNDERALTLPAEHVVETILQGARMLAEAGSVAVPLILERSFVTPACGTGALPVATAEACLTLAAEASRAMRVRGW